MEHRRSRKIANLERLLRPKSIAVIGGLAMSTVFTLVALPVWYTAVEDVFSIIARLLPRGAGVKRFRLPRGGILMHRRS